MQVCRAATFMNMPWECLRSLLMPSKGPFMSALEIVS